MISIFWIFQLSSQHPYAETFVGKPLVYTISIWNKTEVARTIKTILKKQVRKLKFSHKNQYYFSLTNLWIRHTYRLLFFYFIGQTICSFRIFLRRNFGKIERFHRKSSKNNSIYCASRLFLSPYLINKTNKNDIFSSALVHTMQCTSGFGLQLDFMVF